MIHPENADLIVFAPLQQQIEESSALLVKLLLIQCRNLIFFRGVEETGTDRETIIDRQGSIFLLAGFENSNVGSQRAVIIPSFDFTQHRRGCGGGTRERAEERK
jgi:hypothetical protein